MLGAARGRYDGSAYRRPSVPSGRLRDNHYASDRCIDFERKDSMNDTVKYLPDENRIPRFGSKRVGRSFDEAELAMALAGLPSVPP